MSGRPGHPHDRPGVPPFRVIQAQLAHAAAISRLHCALFESGWDIASVERTLSHPGSIAFIATGGTGTDACGYALAQAAADEAEILSLGTAANCRRKGIAEGLLRAVKQAAFEAGTRRLFLEVAASNRAALSLYEKAGFEKIGVRPRYYTSAAGTSDDALILGLPFDAKG